jgi:hypothetical protein
LAREEIQHAGLAKAENENRRLRSEQLTEEEEQQLEGEHIKAQALRARLIALQHPDGAASVPAAKGETLAKDWRYSGSATPKDALISVLWAASRGDIDDLAGLIGFAPEVRGRVEAVFESLPAQSRLEYGSPERVVATFISGTFPKDASGATFVDADEDGAESSVDLRVSRSDGQSRTNEYRLDHAPGGWRLLVPSNVISGYERMLQGEPPSPSESAPP